jgi:hypothetical protein
MVFLKEFIAYLIFNIITIIGIPTLRINFKEHQQYWENILISLEHYNLPMYIKRLSVSPNCLCNTLRRVINNIRKYT